MKRRDAILLFVLVAAGAGVGMFLILSGGNPFPTNIAANDADAGGQTKQNNLTRHETDPAKEAAKKYDALTDAAGREAHIRWVARQEWARWDTPLLRRAILSDPSEAVRIAALEEASNLARKAGGDAPTQIVRIGLASGRNNTRAAALKEARENADPAFVDELIGLVDARDRYAPMALTALAHTDNEKAHAKILEIAEDERAEPALRQRAITLIAITKDREALPLLDALVRGDDANLARIAREVRAIILER